MLSEFVVAMFIVIQFLKSGSVGICVYVNLNHWVLNSPQLTAIEKNVSAY